MTDMPPAPGRPPCQPAQAGLSPGLLGWLSVQHGLMLTWLLVRSAVFRAGGTLVHWKAIAIDFGRQGAQGHAHVQAVRGPLIDAALVRTGALMTAHRST
jgi:hypothetical protein